MNPGLLTKNNEARANFEAGRERLRVKSEIEYLRKRIQEDLNKLRERVRFRFGSSTDDAMYLLEMLEGLEQFEGAAMKCLNEKEEANTPPSDNESSEA